MKKSASYQEVQPPLLVKEWKRKVLPVKKQTQKKAVTLELQRITLTTEQFKSVKLQKNEKEKTVSILIRSNEIGKQRFPADIKTVKLSTAVFNNRKLKDLTHGYMPSFLPRTQFPKFLSKELEVRQRFISEVKRRKGVYGLPSNIFSPDERYTFSDTAFPWCTCGRVDTASGWGSGVMIGPRHMMTASHVINWGPNNTAGWVKFTPLFFDGSTPFGVAWATKIYSWVKVNGSDGINSNETAFDYVVCVLGSRMGDNATGWMGSRGYDSGWNGGDYWGHIGYPQDLSGGQRPSFIGYQDFDSTFSESASGRSSFGIKHKIDVIPGQSGGPYFGWWENEPWPRVVSIQSAHQWGGATGPNTCGGGNPLSELINYARNTEP